MTSFVGLSGAYKALKLFLGLGGVHKTVQGAWIGVGGSWMQFYSATAALVISPVNGFWSADGFTDPDTGILIITGYTGSCSVSVSGGVTPYHYTWDLAPGDNTNTYGTSVDPNGLTTVTATCTVTDSSAPPVSGSATCTIG